MVFGASGEVKSLYRKGREEKPQRPQKKDAWQPHGSGFTQLSRQLFPFLLYDILLDGSGADHSA
jgi:hypothetical protein